MYMCVIYMVVLSSWIGTLDGHVINNINDMRQDYGLLMKNAYGICVQFKLVYEFNGWYNVVVE